MQDGKFHQTEETKSIEEYVKEITERGSECEVRAFRDEIKIVEVRRTVRAILPRKAGKQNVKEN